MYIIFVELLPVGQSKWVVGGGFVVFTETEATGRNDNTEG